jgi:hypothetical protein
MRFPTRTFVLAAALVSFAATSAPLAAQGSRAELLRQATAAYDNFDLAGAARFARTALNPALGPRDTTWARGVHLMTQLLIEDNQAAQAAIWAKWAMRIEPGLQIDTVNFIAGVVTALQEARTAAVRTAGDDATIETFVWPAVGSTDAGARFRLAPSATNPTVLVRGRGLVTAGAGLALEAGTYELEVNANGFLPIRLTREALPGVTTELSFRLTSAAAAAATLAADVRTRVDRSVVPLTVTRFGVTTAACAVGATASGGRLVLTSYSAVRGADAITSGAAVGDAVRIAAYDVAANLAVLVVPSANADTIPLASALVDGQALYGLGLGATDCRTVRESRVVLNEWPGRPTGNALVLSAAPGDSTGRTDGQVLVDYQGNIGGVWVGGPSAVSAPAAAALLSRARVNVAAGTLLTPQAVAVATNHRYGQVVIAADVPNATIIVTPLEAWHWEALADTSNAPLTFNAPAGRYRVSVSAPNIAARQQEITVRAGERTRAAISLRSVAGGPAQPTAEPRRGLPKWVWIAALGGGAVAAAALGGGGGGGPGTGIDISFPNPTP